MEEESETGLQALQRSIVPSWLAIVDVEAGTGGRFCVTSFYFVNVVRIDPVRLIYTVYHHSRCLEVAEKLFSFHNDRT